MTDETQALAAQQHAIGRLVPFLETMRAVAELAWRRAAQQLDPLAAYYDDVARALETAAAGLAAPERRALARRPTAGPRALLLVTAERGLCGPFAARLVRYGMEQAQALAADGQTVHLLCLGTRGRVLLEAARRPLLYARPLPSLTVPSYVQVETIALELVDRYERGDFARLDVVHHRATTRFQYAPVIESLLPPPLAAATRAAPATPVLPPGDAAALVAHLQSELVLIGLAQAVMESAACEQLARVYAMRLAAERAQQRLADLTLAYQMARQQEVTSALLDVIAGYESARGA